MTISPESKQAVESQGRVRVEDPETHAACVIVTAALFDRMQAMIVEEDIDPSSFEIEDEDFEPSCDDP